MRKKIYLLIALFITVALGVTGYVKFKYADVVMIVNEKVAINTTPLQFIRQEVLEFALDSMTDPNNILYFELYSNVETQKEYLTFLNSDINAIYFYNLHSKSFERKIDLNNYGYEIESLVQGYHIINDDSLFVYSYKDSDLSLLSLAKGKIFNINVDSRLSDAINNVHPLLTTRTPILEDKRNGKIYMTGFSSHEGGPVSLDKTRNVVAQFSIADGSLKHAVNYPSFYWAKNWGGGSGLRQVFFDLFSDTLIVSFMADHNVHLYDSHLREIKTCHFGSSDIGSILSMKYSNNYKEWVSSAELYKYYLSTPSYSLVKFDKYRDRFYRVAESTKLYMKGNYFRKRKTLLVMDRSFNILGGWKLPDEEVEVDDLMIDREGILIKCSVKGSDKLVFNRYKLGV